MANQKPKILHNDHFPFLNYQRRYFNLAFQDPPALHCTLNLPTLQPTNKTTWFKARPESPLPQQYVIHSNCHQYSWSVQMSCTLYTVQPNSRQDTAAAVMAWSMAAGEAGSGLGREVSKQLPLLWLVLEGRDAVLQQLQLCLWQDSNCQHNCNNAILQHGHVRTMQSIKKMSKLM